ncbi:hypothetical protein AMIS_10230 [Actinoplanes missouriensis 431]|uniref:Uncharacterized protein n=1 Tax=Actinoplanes missouriensis (strain ATCC 14538 / DSM 43046 / CBS 188.64 / JCM 3121 / NBRC 102363 / NCIMB 12654 / NRRL B-3342 / UNCC 431) TaxID=512565 RepID=I0GZQ6_ACTM4|nr:hypothetical protein [Actinoplanes missouriensis]BAL86243.1 hypothetical protein AMIS_10230 [Actinoplanes missouriensis 431]
MARGPSTLFGAIVAVGVGPALWLGAQLGTADVAPNERPSTVVGEQGPESDIDFGGVGAGETPDQADWIRVYPDSGDDGETAPSPAVKRTSMSPAAVVVTPGSPSPSPSSPAVASSPPPSPPPSDPVVPPSPSFEGEPSSEPSAEPSDEVTEDPEPSVSAPPEENEAPEPLYSAHE